MLEKLVVSFLIAGLCLAGPVAFSQSKLEVVPTPSEPILFGVHDIGTTSPNRVIVTNKGDANVGLQVAITGSDFSWTSDCLKQLPPGRQCPIIVLFTPTASALRESSLVISSASGQQITLALTGTGFANLAVVPSTITYGDQLVGGSTAPRAVTVTNNTGHDLTDLSVAASGDFTETHSNCQTLHFSSSCVVSVVFSPKQEGAATGALTVSAKSATDITSPRVVALEGKGILHCSPIGWTWSFSTQVLLSLGFIYFVGLALVRWHMIAKPARLQLTGQIAAVRARVESETAALPSSPETDERKNKIHWLLDLALIPITSKSFPMETSLPREIPRYTRVFNAWFWPRGHELAGWNLVHEAERELVALLSLERVRAMMESAEQELRAINSPTATAMADRLRDALQQGDVIFQEKLRGVLQQAIIFQSQDIPDAARKALVSNTSQKVANFLEDFLVWTTANNSAPPASPADCQARMQAFSGVFAYVKEIGAETKKLLQDWTASPAAVQSVLKRVSGFLDQFVDVIGKAGSQPTDAECNSLVTLLGQLAKDAAVLKTVVNVSPQASQDVRDFQDFLTKSKPQMDVFLAVVKAVQPLTAAELLHEIRTILDADRALAQRIGDAQSAKTTDAVSRFRPLLGTFAFSLPLASDLEGKIQRELAGQLPLVSDRWRSLLMEALGFIYDVGDTEFSKLADWHSKLIWLVLCALMFMAALAFTFQNGVLLLVGAIGGLLSRLQRNLQAADVANDYGASWGALFLSPLAGALSAWAGILLVIVGVKLNVFGTALNVNWCNPYDAMALGIALVFGFLERQFDFAVNQISGKFGTSPSPSSSGTAVPTPKVNSPGPLQASAGKETRLNVSGANFQPGIGASFTDSSGKTVKAAVEYKDANNLVVILTPSGSTAYQSVLTLTNPDKQTATVNLSVVANS